MVLKIFSFGFNGRINPRVLGGDQRRLLGLKGHLSQEHRCGPALSFLLLFPDN